MRRLMSLCAVYCTALWSFDKDHTSSSHDSSGHVTQQKPVTSSNSSSSNSSIPNPQAYMINPLHQLRSHQFNPSAGVCQSQAVI